MFEHLFGVTASGLLQAQQQAAAFLAFATPAQLVAFSLILIVLAGLLGGLAAKRLKQPLFLGYILAGVLVGAVYLTLFKANAYDSLQGLANIGVALLLFSMGLEFSKSDIAPVRSFAVWGAVIQVALTLVCGYGIACWSGFTGATAMLFGTAFVSTSTAVVLKTLTAKGRMGTLSSRVMIGLSITQDLTVMPLALLICNLKNLNEGLVKATVPLLYGAVFLCFMVFIGGRAIKFLLQRVAAFNNKELFLLAVTGVGLGVGFIAECMYMSFSFGAFVAGIVLADSPYGKKALYELAPVRDLFAMLFFVSVGMLLELDFFFRSLGMILLLMFATSFARTLFLPALSWLFGYRNVIPTAMFFGMFATSEIAFVVIQTGRDTGLFSPYLYNMILCVVVCSMIAGPLMENFTVPVYRLVRKLRGSGGDVRTITLPLPPLNDHVIIAGSGEIARSIATLLSRLNLSYIIIDPEHGSFRTDQQEHLVSIYGDPQQEVILREAGIVEARMFLAISDSFTENWMAIRSVQSLRRDLPVITRGEGDDEITMLNSVNIDTIVRPRFEAGLEITRLTLMKLEVPALEIQNYLDQVRSDNYKTLLGAGRDYQLLSRLHSFLGMVELNWVRLPDDSSFAHRTLAELNIRSRCGVSIVGIIRDAEFIANAGPQTRLEACDVIGVIGSLEQRKHFEQLAGAPLAATPAAASSEAKHEQGTGATPVPAPATGGAQV